MGKRFKAKGEGGGRKKKKASSNKRDREWAWEGGVPSEAIKQGEEGKEEAGEGKRRRMITAESQDKIRRMKVYTPGSKEGGMYYLFIHVSTDLATVNVTT